MDVHLRELRYFVAVAEHLHFTRAAEALYVSQPSLSKQIHALEARLGTALLRRDRRTVSLTPSGAAFLPEARRVLDAWETAQCALAAATGTAGATLVVGMSSGLGRGVLPASRAQFQRSAPDATLRMRQVPWEDATGGLASEDEGNWTDAAFLWLPIPAPDRFDWITIATEPRLVAMRADHRLAGRETVAFADLLDEPFLALPPESGDLRDSWLAVEARGGVPVRIGAEISTTDETVEALLAGLGVCLIAAGNAPIMMRDEIVIRPVTGLSPSELVLAWRRGDGRQLLHRFVESVSAAIGTTTRGS